MKSATSTIADSHRAFGDYGKCDLCPDPAASILTSDGRTERLCANHGSIRVKRANLDTYRRQLVERQGLQSASPRCAVPVVLLVSSTPNDEGSYTASVANPILSCDIGFGDTPYRALKDLAAKIQDAPDRILQAIIEHEREIHLLEVELGKADV